MPERFSERNGIQRGDLGSRDLVGAPEIRLKITVRTTTAGISTKDSSAIRTSSISHHRRKTQDLDQIFEQLDQNVGVHVVECFHIVGDAGNNLSYGSQIKETHGQALHMGEKLVADLID